MENSQHSRKPSPPPPNSTCPHLHAFDEQRAQSQTRGRKDANGCGFDIRHLQPAFAREENVAILVNMLWSVSLWCLCQQDFFFLNRSNDYRGDSNLSALFTPLTFLATYFNSGVNPLLYAILSRNFRKGMSELLICSFKPNKGKAMNKRTVTHVSKINSILLTHTNGNSEKARQMSPTVIEFDSTCVDFVPNQ